MKTGHTNAYCGSMFAASLSREWAGLFEYKTLGPESILAPWSPLVGVALAAHPPGNARTFRFEFDLAQSCYLRPSIVRRRGGFLNLVFNSLDSDLDNSVLRRAFLFARHSPDSRGGGVWVDSGAGGPVPLVRVISHLSWDGRATNLRGDRNR